MDTGEEGRMESRGVDEPISSRLFIFRKSDRQNRSASSAEPRGTTDRRRTHESMDTRTVD